MEDINKVIVEWKPDFVAYSIITGEQKWAYKFNKNLKKKYKFKSIFGGSHPTCFPEEANQEGIDYWVIGDGEEAIIKIIEGKTEKIVKEPLIDNINSRIFPDRSLIYKYPEFRDNSMKNVITGRHCPYSCSFCFSQLYQKLYKDELCNLFKKRSVDNVIQEIKEIKKDYPLEKIHFNDDNFIPVGDWIDEFVEKYPKEIGLPFVCSLSVNFITDESVKKLKRAGLEMVKFAIETFSEDIRMGILNKKHITNKNIIKAIKIFKKYKIRTRTFNMIGLPLEDSLGEALKTLKFNQELQPTESAISIFQPHHKLPLTEYAIKKGYLTSKIVDKNEEGYFTKTCLLLKDKEKINRLVDWWHFLVKYKIPMEIINFLLEIPITKELKNKMLNIRLSKSKKEFYGIK